MVVWDFFFHQQYDGLETFENVVALVQCTWKIQNIIHFADTKLSEAFGRNLSTSVVTLTSNTPGPHYHKKPSVHQPSSEAFHQTAPERKENQQRKRQQLLNHHHKDNNNSKKRSINSISKEADRNLRLQMLGMRSHSCIYHSILELSPCLLSTTFGNLTALHL